MAATITAPIRERQINDVFYVAAGGSFPTIQSAIDYARIYNNGVGQIVIAHGHGYNEDLTKLTGGDAAIVLVDVRDGRYQYWTWNGTNFAPFAFNQTAGFIAQGEPPDTPAASMFGFDPTATNGAGAGNVHVMANAGMGMPSFNLTLEPQDGTHLWTFLRCALDLNGLPRVQSPTALELYSLGTSGGIFPRHYNLWVGQDPDINPAKGMYVWARDDQNAIDLQGQTVGGSYDQTIRLNQLGGDVEIAPLGNTSITKLTLGGDPTLPQEAATKHYVDEAIAESGNFVYPGAGITVSTGVSWDTPIDPATLATVAQLGNYLPLTGGTLTGPLSINDGNPFTLNLSNSGQHSRFISIYHDTTQPGCVELMGMDSSNGQQIRYFQGLWASGAPQCILGAPTIFQDGAGNQRGSIDNKGNLTTSGNIVTNVNNGSGVTASGVGGLTLGWNAKGGNGETDFINSNAGAGGGFNWYNVAPATAITSSTVPTMWLDSNSQLHTQSLDVRGAVQTGYAPMDSTGHVILGQVSGTPLIYFQRGTGGTAQQNLWSIEAWDGQLRFAAATDDGATKNLAMSIIRSGASPSQFYINTSVTRIGTNSSLTFFDRQSVAQANYPTTPYICNDAVNMFLQGGRGANGGALYLNWDGPCRTNFGSGYAAIVAQVDTDGSFRTAGKIEVGEIGTVINNAHHLAITCDAAGQGVGHMYVVQEGVGYGDLHINEYNGTVYLGAGGVLSVFNNRVECWQDFSVLGGHNKAFVMSHPLDDTKMLVHSCLEGPEVGVYYRGESETVDGYVVITLPDYFEALTRQEERTVQLTMLADEEKPVFALLAAGRIKDGKFTVRSNKPTVKFCWEVKAIRAEIEVVRDKTEQEREHEKNREAA